MAAPVAAPAVGAPGTPLRGAAPTLPPLPGETSVAQQALEDVMPADAAKEIKELRKRLDAVQRAGKDTVNPAPTPVTRSVDVTQAPGETPPVLRVATGLPSNIVFVDSTGAPWPIAYVTPGAPNQFDTLVPEAKSAIVQVRPKDNYSFGGMTVKLEGNNTPISITLTAAQKQADARLEIHLPKRGPNANPILTAGGSTGQPNDPVLSSFLDGIPPAGAKTRTTSMKGVSAWTHDGMLYVRTSAALAAPNWFASKESGDGTRVYRLPDVSTLTVSVDGVMTLVSISE